MQLEYLYSPIEDLFLRLDLGYFEEMFGGFGGEVLYRPFDHKGSVAFSLHKVKQREFNQRFAFRDYSNTTGHLSFYYDFPGNLQVYDIKDSALQEIFERITQDIFNETLAKW